MKKFTSSTQKTGEIGEAVAFKYLVKEGYKIVEKNYTIPGGEVDIVARDTSGVYVFCEVKAIQVSHKRETWPVWQNFSSAKLKKLHRTMNHYAKVRGVNMNNCELAGLMVFLNKDTRLARCNLIRPLV